MPDLDTSAHKLWRKKLTAKWKQTDRTSAYSCKVRRTRYDKELHDRLWREWLELLDAHETFLREQSE